MRTFDLVVVCGRRDIVHSVCSSEQSELKLSLESQPHALSYSWADQRAMPLSDADLRL